MPINQRKREDEQRQQSRAIKLAREQASKVHDIAKIGAQGLETRETMGVSRQGQMDLQESKGETATKLQAMKNRGALSKQGLVGEQSQADIKSRGDILSGQIGQRGDVAATAAGLVDERARAQATAAQAADIYKSGGDPADAASIASAGSFGVDYSGLKRQTRPSKFTRTPGRVLSDSPEGKTYERATIFEQGTGKSTLEDISLDQLTLEEKKRRLAELQQQ